MEQPPTPTLALFAEELRRARAQRKISQEGLASQIHFSKSLVAKVELGHRRPGREFARRCDELLETDGLLTRIYEALASDLVPWFAPWAQIEQEAVSLCSFEPMIIPGLLQTEGYARAVLRVSIGDPDELAAQVAARVERQSILDRDQPPLLVVVLDAQTLRRPVGTPEVMREQLEHLISVGERPHVHIHVVPESAGAYSGLGGAFALATTAEGEQVAYVDNPLRGYVIDRPADMIQLRQLWEHIRAEALPSELTRQLIRKECQRWTS